MYDIDQFLINTSLLTEASSISGLSDMIDNPKFNKLLKQYLPKTFTRYGAISNNPTIFKKIGMKVKENKALNKYINSKIDKKESKNLHIKTFEVNDKDVNAFTIPGFHLGMKNVSLSQAIFGSAVARGYKIDGGVAKSGRVILTASKDVTPLILTTSAFNDDDTFLNNERMAIIMHEIGHWSAHATIKQLPAPVFALLSGVTELIRLLAAINTWTATTHSSYQLAAYIFVISIAVSIVLAVINGMLSRAAEFAADAFAKKVGMGHDLSDSLQKLYGLSSIKDLDELNELATLADKLSPITDFLIVSSHPSRYRRSSRLLEDASILQEGIVSDMSQGAVEKILTPVMSKLDNIVARKFRPMLYVYGSK